MNKREKYFYRYIYLYNIDEDELYFRLINYDNIYKKTKEGYLCLISLNNAYYYNLYALFNYVTA